MLNRKKYISKSANADEHISRRTMILSIGLSGVFALASSRLAYLQLYKHKDYKSLSDENRITHRLIQPSRGIIYNTQGMPIAENIESYHASIILEEVSDIHKALASLNNVLPEKKIDINKTIKKIKKSKKFVPVQIVNNLSWDEFAKLNSNLYQLKGVFPSVGYKRFYPEKESHAHLLGYISDISKEEYQENPFSKLNNAKSGKIGIEKSFDKELRGRLGSKSIEINAFGREIRELKRIEGQVGKNIQLTVDSDVQNFCFNLLKGVSGSISVIDVNTGYYIALASAPAFDPNKFSEGISSSDWQALLNNKYKPLINKSISSFYPPGSTIKPLVALAALESGISPNEIFSCNGKHEVEDTSLESGIKTFHCWKKDGHKEVNMNKAIKVSCDVYFYHIARRVGIDKIAEVCRRFGLGNEVFDLFYEEQPGIVPDKKWKRATLGKKWLIGETLVSAIGQSYFLSTSSQLSLAFAQIVNGGKQIRPNLIYKDGDNNVKIPTLLAAQSHLKILMKALDDATNEQGGTSYRSRILGENKMAGKTGTSQVRVISEKEREEGIIKNKDLPWNKRDHGLYVGYGPIDNPKYAVSVIIEHGGSGSRAAAPMASKIFKFLFRKKMDIKRSSIVNV
tara:strand:- start:6280 stop:8151 length:1872 start_codon:yes stop_codon:yes gene_type:complete